MCLLSSCTSAPQDESTAKKEAVSPQLLADSDKLFDQRPDLSKLRVAIANMTRARRENAKSFEIESRLARYNYYLGRYSEDEKEREKAFEDGKAAGKSASKIDPNKPDGYFWFGANLGEQASRNPLAVGVRSVDDIRESMNKVVEIQPNYEMASAYDVLGQLELGTRLMGGTPQKAAEYLEKAVEIEKFNGEARIHLAEAYLALGKDADAKKQLDFVLQMKPNPAYLPEYAQQVAKAKKMLETKF